LRHGQVWRDGKAWTLAHERWLVTQRFTEPALQTTYDHYRAVLQGRDAQPEAIEADLAVWQDRAPFAEAVARLSAYRGVTRLGALHLAAEVGDWRRFARASAFMGFCGLVPSEYSSGQVTRRGHITKAGNLHLRTQLVESAWALKHRPRVGARLASRQQGLTPRCWLERGPPSRDCVGGSDAWPPASLRPTSSLPPSPGSWPGSCGPRWQPEPEPRPPDPLAC
jgi:transposase